MPFVRNHTKAIIATDFFVVVTATFRLIYVLVIMELDITLTSLNIRQPSGRFNSSENALAVTKDTDSLSMIVTVSILKTWISR